jgi:hypothetical protein
MSNKIMIQMKVVGISTIYYCTILYVQVQQFMSCLHKTKQNFNFQPPSTFVYVSQSGLLKSYNDWSYVTNKYGTEITFDGT